MPTPAPRHRPLAAGVAGLACAGGLLADGRIEPVPFTAVRATDRVVAPRIEANRLRTIPACLARCEESGRIANFDAAAARVRGVEGPSFVGNCYDDSDVYKVIEGAAYALAAHPDPALEERIDALIRRVAAAQEPDGYLYTIATANGRARDARWKDEQWSHETYCAGHLFEAAVAYYQATGKEHLLDISRRFADLLVEEFLEGDRREVPGHQGVEIGLVRLYRATGVRNYLDLAKALLLRRGSAEGRELYGEYAQDHRPLVEQREAVGHAVRAGYLYSAMADLASVTGETIFDEPLDALWRDVVGTKLYLTGGIGASARNEGFAGAYELPNESAYAETCASIANVLWNHRMFLRTGSAEPIDVLERTLHNALLAGVALDGERFHYPNPLAWNGTTAFNHGEAGRAAWFRCACCPVNIARFVPSIPGFAYALTPAQGEEPPTIHALLPMASSAEFALGSGLRIVQTTDYPWDGRVTYAIEAPEPVRARIALRIPGWARGRPVPSDLYRYESDLPAAWTIDVNGERATPALAKGFATVDRVWKDGDRIELDLPMTPRRVRGHEAIEATRGRVAFERGPIVYCVEAADQSEGLAIATLRLPADATIATTRVEGLPEGTVALELGAAPRVVAIPYALWGNRSLGAMAVWLRRAESAD